MWPNVDAGFFKKAETKIILMSFDSLRFDQRSNKGQLISSSGGKFNSFKSHCVRAMNLHLVCWSKSSSNGFKIPWIVAFNSLKGLTSPLGSRKNSWEITSLLNFHCPIEFPGL